MDSCDDETREKDVVKIVNQISGCHGIFIRIENPLLTTLQTDLGRSSSEIFSLSGGCRYEPETEEQTGSEES